MKFLSRILLAGALALSSTVLGWAASAVVGQAAPDFTLKDLSGKSHSLSEFKGKTVVLEWTNPECPIVGKHYDKSGNIPKIQQAAAGDGVIWLQINSGHPGSEGDFAPAQVAQWQKRNHSVSTAYFRDLDGKVGKLYDARTTPHLFIVDGSGTLVYAGGIDSIRSSRAQDIPEATNYVKAALGEIKAGKPVTIKNSQPYGCAVQYGE